MVHTISVVNNSSTELSNVVKQTPWPNPYDSPREKNRLFIDHLGIAEKTELIFKGELNGKCISLRSE